MAAERCKDTKIQRYTRAGTKGGGWSIDEGSRGDYTKRRGVLFFLRPCGAWNEVQTLRIISRTFCEFVILKLLLPRRRKSRMEGWGETRSSMWAMFLPHHDLPLILLLRCCCCWNKLSLIGSFFKVCGMAFSSFRFDSLQKKTLAEKEGKQECRRRSPNYRIFFSPRHFRGESCNPHIWKVFFMNFIWSPFTAFSRGKLILRRKTQWAIH